MEARLDKVLLMANASHSVLIAVDGVAPRAKVNQQRERRYKSVAMAEQCDAVREREDLPGRAADAWDSNMITPGTAYMRDLGAFLHDWAARQTVVACTVTVSGPDEHGEGEHKLLKQIRARREAEPHAYHVVYGKDADLVILGLATGVEHFAVLREDQFKDDVMCLLNVDVIRELLPALGKRIKDFDVPDAGIHPDDLVVLSLLVGNDFIPRPPASLVQTGGLTFLCKVLMGVTAKSGERLVREKDEHGVPIVNADVLRQVMLIMSNNEDQALGRAHGQKLAAARRQIEKPRQPPRRPRNADDAPAVAKYVSDTVDFEARASPPPDPVELGKEGWRERYYATFFNSGRDIPDAARAFYDGMCWILRYYYSGCASWDWFYPYHVAPPAADLHLYYEYVHRDFELGMPMDPQVQLMLVLPPTSAARGIEDQRLRSLVCDRDSPLAHYFPTTIELTMAGAHAAYAAIALLPWVDMDEVMQHVEQR